MAAPASASNLDHAALQMKAAETQAARDKWVAYELKYLGDSKSFKTIPANSKTLTTIVGNLLLTLESYKSQVSPSIKGSVVNIIPLVKAVKEAKKEEDRTKKLEELLVKAAEIWGKVLKPGKEEDRKTAALKQPENPKLKADSAKVAESVSKTIAAAPSKIVQIPLSPNKFNNSLDVINAYKQEALANIKKGMFGEDVQAEEINPARLDSLTVRASIVTFIFAFRKGEMTAAEFEKVGALVHLQNLDVGKLRKMDSNVLCAFVVNPGFIDGHPDEIMVLQQSVSRIMENVKVPVKPVANGVLPTAKPVVVSPKVAGPVSETENVQPRVSDAENKILQLLQQAQKQLAGISDPEIRRQKTVELKMLLFKHSHRLSS